MADLPLFSSSFVQSNDTIVTTTVELVSVCMILVTGCHGKRVLATFAFHLPRVSLNAVVCSQWPCFFSSSSSSGSQSILERSRAPPLPRPIGFAMKPACASMSRSTFSVHRHNERPLSSFRLFRPPAASFDPNTRSYIYLRSYVVCHALLPSHFRRNEAIFIPAKNPTIRIFPFPWPGTFVAGTTYFVANATILKPMTHTIDSSYPHYFHSIFLPPLLPIPSSYLHCFQFHPPRFTF
jgi:hypothetical protein